ncbi:MAG: hypothetical protein UX94_C0001G0039 [Parcubacteria group bacterium GW2011_GWA2_47_21]|nr:MAG: hypothetical protein UX94_C0001G0039 [Parcubacteria group bacterium GW2011_GWA2_47_21]
MKKFFGKKAVIISAIVFGLLVVASSASADSLKMGFGARLAASVKQEAKMVKLREKMDNKLQKTQERFARQMERLQEKFRFDDWDDEEDEMRVQKRRIMLASTTPMVIHISARGQASLSGTVEGINASTTLMVKSWGGNWNVLTNASTTIISAGRTLSDIHIGDRIILRGQVGTTSAFMINAKLIKDLTP